LKKSFKILNSLANNFCLNITITEESFCFSIHLSCSESYILFSSSQNSSFETQDCLLLVPFLNFNLKKFLKSYLYLSSSDAHLYFSSHNILISSSEPKENAKFSLLLFFV
jgi:hypothetical protein